MSVVVTRSRQLAVGIAALALLSWILWCSWAWGSGLLQAPVLLHGFLTLIANGFLVAYWVASPRGTLNWDGTSWDWRQQESEAGPMRLARVEVCLDWQWGQLLRMNGAGRAVWIWLDSAMARDHWQDFRRATAFQAGLPLPSRDPGMLP